MVHLTFWRKPAYGTGKGVELLLVPSQTIITEQCVKMAEAPK
jgi:hypothetical protein